MAILNLKSGKCSITDSVVEINGIQISYEDMAEICRAYLTKMPLEGDSDIRLKLIQDIRTSTIKAVTKSPTRHWIVLDAPALFEADCTR